MGNLRNYQKELDTLIDSLDGRKRLLLHACCAPCSSYCIEYLKEYFDITLFFYNPNITDKAEFDKRVAELKRLVAEMGLDIEVVIPQYDPAEFLDRIKGCEACPEGGDRCSICYALRLERTCRYAQENDFDFFCSTLSISPYKNCEKLNSIGEALAKDKNVCYLPNDFKKKGGYARSVQLSKEYNLYRQNFCGCIFSQNEKSV